MKNIREDIKEEMEEYRKKCPIGKDKYGMTWKAKYFNNFFCHLPLGYYRTFFDKDFYETEKNITSEGLRKGKTLKEVHEDVDNVIEETIKDKKKFRELEKKMHEIKNKKEDYMNAFDELMDMAFPAYICLREMGYSKHDLVG